MEFSRQEPGLMPVRDHPRLEFRVDPLVDLIFLARSIDPKKEESRVDFGPELLAAAEAAAALDRALGNPLSWGLLADIFTSAESVSDIVESCDKLPEEIQTAGGSLRFRAEAIIFARALAAVEPMFLANLWPARRAEIDAKLQSLQNVFDSTAEPWMPFVLTHLSMVDPQEIIPVYLVGDGPWPGAVTYRSRAEGGMCFVAIDSAEGSQLVETIIHEAIHALDVSTADEPTALNQLRAELRETGVGSSDPLMRNLPHLLIFVQAAETTRRCIAPEHVDYGVTHGVYERLEPGASVVREHWPRSIERSIDLPTAIVEIVRDATSE
jgi:hypothetical protein